MVILKLCVDHEPISLKIRLLLRPNEDCLTDFYNLKGNEFIQGNNLSTIKLVVNSVIVRFMECTQSNF